MYVCVCGGGGAFGVSCQTCIFSAQFTISVLDVCKCARVIFFFLNQGSLFESGEEPEDPLGTGRSAHRTFCPTWRLPVQRSR